MKKYLFALTILLMATVATGGENGVPGIRYTPLKQIVPGDGLPKGLDLGGSNNNLDIVKHDGKIFFAFRTALTHFASRGTRFYVLSSADGEKWELENKIAMGRDMREPRFLSFKGRLFLYFFTAGKNPWTFSPQYVWMSEYKGPGKWTTPAKIWKPGYVDWRAKEHNGVAIMSTYLASGITETKGDKPSELSLLKSDDGVNWEFFDPNKPVQVFGAGEADFEFDDAGNLYTIVRNESGASRLCSAPASNIADWQCKETPMKYDSPLMFKHGGTIYLIARRNLSGDFYHDMKHIGDHTQALLNMGRYWVTRKRTALYRFNTEKMEIEWLFDFPSRGDTAFPALVKMDENRYLMFNYSSPIDGPDRVWVAGQLTGTRIYSTEIIFE